MPLERWAMEPEETVTRGQVAILSCLLIAPLRESPIFVGWVAEWEGVEVSPEIEPIERRWVPSGLALEDST